MHNFDVKSIASAENITEEIARSPNRSKNLMATKAVHLNFTKDAVNHIWMNNLLHNLCAGEHTNALEKVKKIIDEDPWRNIRETNDPEHLLNMWGPNL